MAESIFQYKTGYGPKKIIDEQVKDIIKQANDKARKNLKAENNTSPVKVFVYSGPKLVKTFLSMGDAATFYGVDRSTIANRIKRGSIIKGLFFTKEKRNDK